MYVYEIQDGRKLHSKNNEMAYEESKRQVKIEEKDTERKFEKLDEEKKMMEQVFGASTKNKSSGNTNSQQQQQH